MEIACSALVIFGVTGDLVRKKVFAALYELQLLDRLNMPVIGVGRSNWNDDTLRRTAETAIRSHAADDVVNDAMHAVLGRLTYVRGDYSSNDLYETLQRSVAAHEMVLYYLAVPPTVFGAIITGLGGTAGSERARVLIEKPFGSDLETARSPLTLTDVVFGQYDGYLDVDGVSPGSTTDTFVHARLSIDNDRWRDVSWTITAGKALEENLSEVVVTFKPASAPMFISNECEPEPNQLRVQMAPEESIVLTMQARSSAVPLGTARTALASADNYRPTERLEAYARIFDDARRGDQTRFASCEVLEKCWRILDGVVHRTITPKTYARGVRGTAPRAHVVS